MHIKIAMKSAVVPGRGRPWTMKQNNMEKQVPLAFYAGKSPSMFWCIERNSHEKIAAEPTLPALNELHAERLKAFENSGVDLFEIPVFHQITSQEYQTASHHLLAYIHKIGGSFPAKQACEWSRQGKAKRMKAGLFLSSETEDGKSFLFCHQQTKQAIESAGFSGIRFEACPFCDGECEYSQVNIDIFTQIPSTQIADGFCLYNSRHPWDKDFQRIISYLGEETYVLSSQAVLFLEKYHEGLYPVKCLAEVLNSTEQKAHAEVHGATPCIPGDHEDCIGCAPMSVIAELGFPKYCSWPLRASTQRP